MKVGDKVRMSKYGLDCFPKTRFRTGIVLEINHFDEIKVKRKWCRSHEYMWWYKKYWTKIK